MHYGKPTEGIWSLLKRSIANLAAADLDGLVRILKRKRKKIQYRPRRSTSWQASTPRRSMTPRGPEARARAERGGVAGHAPPEAGATHHVDASGLLP